MNILVTGASGFVGKNLCAALEAIRDGKDMRHADIRITSVIACNRNTSTDELRAYCEKADFVFHLAGVNRSHDEADFVRGNVHFTEKLLDFLHRADNVCPIMFASSVQALCLGRFDRAYAESKRAAEERVFAHARECGAKVLVYRLPNLFGKWCRPNYNSVVATFCHCAANGLPFAPNDRSAQLELLYIDDLVEQLLCDLRGESVFCRFDGTAPVIDECGAYCTVRQTHQVTLGQIADTLARFCRCDGTIELLPSVDGSFEKKLYSTYLSYLPRDGLCIPLQQKADARGSFTELFTMLDRGQFSVNVSLPLATKGRHWHQSKWEIFVVVSGRGQIRLRRLDERQAQSVEVSGEKVEAVYIPPGYVHELVNLSESEKLVTLIWAGERFDAQRPDTFAKEIDI